MSGFERTELPGGVRVVSERVPGHRSASIGLWVRVGSRDEPDALSGVSHFLEHLVFKGTPTRTALAIAETFDAVGGDLNAYTTKEFTCFHARVLPEDVTMAVETMADIVREPLLDPDDVESERSVVLEELAMHEDTPDDIVFDLFQEALWPGTSLGRRVQGTTHTVASMTREQIAAYHSAHYRGGVVLSAAGAVDHEAVVATAQRVLGGAGRTSLTSHASPRAYPGALVVEHREVEQAHLVYGTEGIPRSDERRWALGVLNVALGGGMSSRLFQEIREKRGLAYAVSSGHQGYAHAGVFNVYAGCSIENIEDVMKITRDQIDAVVAAGITPAEHARAIGHLRGSLVMSLDDPGSLMSHLGKSELIEGVILRPEEMIAKIESVTLEQVRAVARDVLAGPWSLTALGPNIEADLRPYVGTAA